MRRMTVEFDDIPKQYELVSKIGIALFDTKSEDPKRKCVIRLISSEKASKSDEIKMRKIYRAIARCCFEISHAKKTKTSHKSEKKGVVR